MLKTLFCSLAVAGLLLLGIACRVEKTPTDQITRDHMAAQATLTSHYIDAALDAGRSAEEINAVLMEISDKTIISEFWITDSEGRVEYTNMPEVDFTFPTDPNSETQAAPFANLLLGTESVVEQNAERRQLDDVIYQYVGVAGVDKPRIVQVGILRVE